MIIVQVAKDVRTFKPKFIGPFSKRQFCCVAIAAAFTFLIYSIFGKTVSTNVLLTVITLVAAPFVLCGFVDVQGLPLYAFAKDVIITNMLSPEKRNYQTTNTYKDACKQMLITREYFTDTENVKKKKKSPKQKEAEQKKVLNKFYKKYPDMKPVI